MEPCASNESTLAVGTREFYYRAIATLHGSGIPFLVGGAYAFGCYTGITRDTKDLDVFVHPGDSENILKTLEAAGYKTELTDRVWLGKAFHADDLVDIIFSSGNGIATVDDDWFKYAVSAELLDLPIKLVPVEEMIWSKSFVMTRERYDGADIAHLLRAHAQNINWERLLRRFATEWQVLYSHLILFGFTYPSERARIPQWVMHELGRRLEREIKSPPPADRVCQGTLLSNSQFQIDVEEWGYRDGRPFK